MKVILSVIFLALSLLYGVHGIGKCTKNEGCGCQLQDASNKPLVDITLEFVDLKYDYKFINDRDFCFSLHRQVEVSEDRQYVYTPCINNSHCEANAAVRNGLQGNQEAVYCF